jgi:hypothetical protein
MDQNVAKTPDNNRSEQKERNWNRIIIRIENGQHSTELLGVKAE